MKEVLGYTPEEFATMDPGTAMAIVHPDDLAAVQASLETLERAGSIDLEYRVRNKDGEYRWISNILSVMNDSSGRPQYRIGSARDITDRKRAEEAFRESRAKLDAALSSMRDAVFISDTEGKFIEFNDAFATFHRFGTKEECAKTLAEYPDFLEVYMPDGKPAPLDMWAVPRALRGETETNAEYKLRRKDTGETWVGSYSFAPIRNKAGAIVGSVVVGRDITARKQAEEAIKESQARLEALFAAIPDMIVEYDATGTMVRANEALLRVAGVTSFTRDLVLGKLDARKADGSPLLPGESPTARALKGSVVKDEIMSITTAEGKHLTVSAYAAPLVRDGIVSGAVGVWNDITDLKQAEDALAAVQKEKIILAELLNSSEQPFGVGYPDGRLGIINGAFERLSGYSAAELRSMDWATVLTPPEWLEMEQKKLEELTCTGIPVRYEKEYLRKDGTRVRIELLVHLVRDSDGKPLHYYSFITDVTERNRAREELLRKNEELTATGEELHQNLDELSKKEILLQGLAWQRQLALDAAGMGWWHYDPVTRMASYDRRYREMFSVKGEKSPNDEILANRMHPDDLPGVWARVERALDPADPQPYEATYRIKLPDGTIKWIEAHGIALFSGTGTDRRATGLVGTVLDITKRREDEDELKQKHEDLNAAYEEITATQEELRQNVDELTSREHQLSQALAEKEVLLSEIHHRVKNNLTAFISLLSLEGSTEDSPAGKLLKQDLQNRARSMALVHETLYRTNQYDDVDMGMYLTTLADQICQSFQGSDKVRLVVDAHGVMLDVPRATPVGLVINELLTNSFKYAFPDTFDVPAERGAPPTITLSLAKTDGTYEMIVKDNGVGLPRDFDLGTAKSLGLKLVNFLARHQLRAKVAIDRENGTGFVFRFKE